MSKEKKLDEVDELLVNFYKRYNNAIKNYRINNFIHELNEEFCDISELKKVTVLIATENIRFVPIIACAYADDLLKFSFKALLPDDIPGGKTDMFSPFGPLSDFSKRLRLAYAFDVFSPFLIRDLNVIKSIRNKIAHSWELKSLDNLIVDALGNISSIEDIFFETDDTLISKDLFDKSTFAKFRLRLIWIISAIFYESPVYAKAKKLNLNPHQILYSEAPPKRLGEIVKASYLACKSIEES
ncbi:MAG: hypothetical protein WBK77_10220 [Alphaproteobacteria bacterium]